MSPSPGPADPASGGSGPQSARESILTIREGLQDHLQARVELLEIEVREAADLAARKAMLGVAAAMIGFFSYTLLLVALVSLAGGWLAARWPGLAAGGWPLAAAVLSALHLGAALVLFTRLRRPPTEPLFEYTRSELRKDCLWIQKKQSKSGKSGSS